VNASDSDRETTENPQGASVLPEPNTSMLEYHRLQQNLLMVTLAVTGVIFISVWMVYSLNIALNYLIGAGTGVVYLKMLARNVEQLGRSKNRLSKERLAVLMGVIILASQLDQLQIIPIFLGFMTYKAAIIFYMFGDIVKS
jgi:ATP synthase protein I